MLCVRLQPPLDIINFKKPSVLHAMAAPMVFDAREAVMFP
jgi:hypothetical protein